MPGVDGERRAPPTLYEPGQASANTYAYNVFGGTTFFPFSIGVTEGNPRSTSESAGTTTAGVVISPFERVTISVDWFEIKLKNAIGVPTHDTVYQQCFDAAYNPLLGSAPGSVTRRAARGRQSVLRPDPARVRRRRAADAGQLRRLLAATTRATSTRAV